MAGGLSKDRYIYAIGRRKSATAQIRLWPAGNGEILVNEKNIKSYFPYFEQQGAIIAPLKLMGQFGKVNISAKVNGGGIRGQAEAIRLGIARALLEIDPDYRKTLRAAGFLTRDPRVKERKKPGLLGARRAPQWAKR